MTVTIQTVGRGTTPGDATGDSAYDGAGKINTNFSNLKAAVEFLEGRHWLTISGVTTADIGERYKCNAHAGFALTMPATFAASASALSDVWVWNNDDASNVTLTPASGDAFFVDGATHGVDTTYALAPGSLVILSPRTTDSEWDLLVVGMRSAVYNNQTGTTYTIQASDNGKVITFSNAAACAVTLPDTLATNFQCTIVQIGAGVPTVTPTTDTINGAGTGVAPSAQWAAMYLSQYSATNWLAII